MFHGRRFAREHACSAYCRPTEGRHADLITCWCDDPGAVATPELWRREFAAAGLTIERWGPAEAPVPDDYRLPAACGRNYLVIWRRGAAAH